MSSCVCRVEDMTSTDIALLVVLVALVVVAAVPLCLAALDVLKWLR